MRGHLTCTGTMYDMCAATVLGSMSGSTPPSLSFCSTVSCQNAPPNNYVFPTAFLLVKDVSHDYLAAFLLLKYVSHVYLAAFLLLSAFPLAQQQNRPSIAVGQKGGSGEEENVDCVIAKEMVTQCNAKCVLDAPGPQTLVGEEVSTTYLQYWYTSYD